MLARKYQASRLQRQSKQPYSMLRLAFVLLAISILIVAFLTRSYQISFFPIKSVKIDGKYSHVDKVAIRSTIAPFLQANMLTIDTQLMSQRLSRFPWIGSAVVKRDWPYGLVVQLQERNAIARWGKDALLDSKGEIFMPEQVSSNGLPLFNAPAGMQAVTWQHYQVMSRILSPLGLHIKQLDVAARQAWSVQLDNGMTLILGRNAPIERLQRLIGIYQRVFGSRGSDVEYVDLRYPNGLAVRWRSQGLDDQNQPVTRTS